MIRKDVSKIEIYSDLTISLKDEDDGILGSYILTDIEHLSIIEGENK